MSLAFDELDGTAIGLVGPTVFSVGADERYIVLKQHPRKGPFEPFNRNITNYFIVRRTTSPSLADRKKGVQGPLTAEEFEKLSTSLTLPPFSKTFADLQ